MTTKLQPLSPELVSKIDDYWRAANYLSVGQIYLYDNPLLKQPLTLKHIKPRLLGHWGTSPGLNLIYVHLNRIIAAHDLNVLFITGPGHGGPSLVAHAYLEGTYTEVYPNVTEDEVGMKTLFTQFSFPGGIPSHVAPETPGSIHEGGELGYALSHAFGAAFDNPDLIVAAVVGDGEAETGPLATSWHSNKFLNPVTDGAVLPILHLNGYKIASPTILARISQDELRKLFEGYGYKPYFVEGHEPEKVHRQLAAVMDAVTAEIQQIWSDARTKGFLGRPVWPMIILRTPKGWTCPAEIDGKKCEDYWRSHQVPMGDMDKPGHVEILEKWMKSYRPNELFDAAGKLKPEIAELSPKGERRMSANPHANGGLLLEDLRMPDYRTYAVEVTSPGAAYAESTRVMGIFLRDVMKLNLASKNFRLFSPDENNSNRWQDVLEVTNRAWMAERYDYDDKLSADGRVMEMLSEHQCQGWLEGYLLTGRHGFFSCYEAFIHIIDSMFNQHAKWLKVCGHIPWRRPIASLNYLLSSHVWRQDHNGFSHQDPGFLDHVANKKAEVIRIYLPPDANTLLSVTDHCLRSRNYVNVIVAGKQPAPQWLTMDEAVKHCAAGLGVWEWASNDKGGEPHVVMACCGDVPTLETLAAVDLLRQHLPEVKVRVVNVVNLMKLQPPKEHPHGLPDKDFDAMFTSDRQILFAFHGYPSLIHQLTYRRTNHRNLHVRGYKEEGTTTTPFDMVVMNDMDRFHLVCDVIDRVPGLAARATEVRRAMVDKRAEHKRYIALHGEDMPEIDGWRWAGRGTAPVLSSTRNTAAEPMSYQQSPNPAETYERYLGPAISDPWTRVLLEYAAPRPGERALDVACGTGSVARHVAPLVGAEGKVIALDVNPDMLAVARALPAPAGATIEWLEGNALNLALPDDAFDLVLCQQGLQFFPDRAAALREMRRVLTEGGRVAISVWQALQRHPVYEALFEATARHLGATIATVELSFSLWDADELRTLLGDAGFRSIEIFPRSLDIHLPSPERFVQLTVLGAATSIPAFAQLDAAARAALVEAVTDETQAVAQRYRDGDKLTFPMFTHIAVAYKK